MNKLFTYSLLFTIILFNNTSSIAQQNGIDSLLLTIKNAKKDTNKVHTLNELSNQFYSIGDYEKEMAYAQQALILSQQLNYKKGTARSLNNIGCAFQDQGNYPQALKTFLASLKTFKMIKDKNGISDTYNNIGEIYRLQGNYAEALQNYYASLKLSEQMGDKDGLANTYNNIGLIYKNQGNYPDALKNFFASLKIDKQTGNKYGIASSYNNIGIIYNSQGHVAKNNGDTATATNKFSNAMKNYFSALKINEALGNKHWIANNYSNIGGLYCYLRNYPMALKNYFASYKIRDETGDKAGIVGSYLDLGYLYTKLKKCTEAKKYFNDALTLSKEIGFMEAIKTSYKSLSILDSIGGDYKQACENYKMHIIYRDSLINQENTKKIVQTQMQYEFDKIQTADSIKVAERTNQENFKHNQAIKQQKIYTYGGIIGFGLMLIVALVSFRAFKNKQKANQLIAHQKLLVEEKQKEVIDSIKYASRIQRALLPSISYIQNSLKKTNLK